MHGGKLNGAAVGTPFSAFVDTGTSLFAGPTKVVNTATWLFLTTTVLSSPEYIVNCSATINFVRTVGGAQSESTRLTCTLLDQKCTQKGFRVATIQGTVSG